MSEYHCPHCNMAIYDEDALTCHLCGESLSRAGKGFISRIRYQNNKVVWFFLVFVVLVAFVLIFTL